MEQHKDDSCNNRYIEHDADGITALVTGTALFDEPFSYCLMIFHDGHTWLAFWQRNGFGWNPIFLGEYLLYCFASQIYSWTNSDAELVCNAVDESVHLLFVSRIEAEQSHLAPVMTRIGRVRKTYIGEQCANGLPTSFSNLKFSRGVDVERAYLISKTIFCPSNVYSILRFEEDFVIAADNVVGAHERSPLLLALRIEAGVKTLIRTVDKLHCSPFAKLNALSIHGLDTEISERLNQQELKTLLV